MFVCCLLGNLILLERLFGCILFVIWVLGFSEVVIWLCLFVVY